MIYCDYFFRFLNLKKKLILLLKNRDTTTALSKNNGKELQEELYLSNQE